MKSNINLNWLRSFEAAARLSGFSSAARELGLTQVAVSQHIKALETKVGHALFIRHAKKVQLTDAGKAYFLSVREGLEKLSHATYGLFGTELDQTIVVRGSNAFLMWLMPRLNNFHHLYPNIKLKFVTSIWPDPADTQKIDIDIALSSSASNKNALKDKLADENLVPVCSLQQSDRVQSIKALLTLEPIHILGFDDHWVRYLGHFGVERDLNKTARLQVDSSVLACELAASGEGCAIVIERFAKAAVQNSCPIKIIGQPAPLNQCHYMINRSSDNDNPISAEIEMFKVWLINEFAESDSLS